MATVPIPSALTPAQISAVAQQATVSMVPLFQPNPTYSVRIGWQNLGQPFQKSSEDVAYVRCYEVDDQYNRVRDVTYINGSAYTKVTNYTRVWEFFWTVYGPNSFDNARLIRTRLFDQDVHDVFAASNLYFVPDIAAPVRVPYEQDGQWWERTDVKARFNEFVTETYNDQYVQSVEIIVDTAQGTQIADVIVEG